MSLFEYSTAYKPFLFPWAVELAVEHERMHWTEEEVDLADDVADWKTPGRLTPAEKNFISQILRMFTQSDVNVGRFYLDYLVPRFKNNEIRNMLASFAAREGTHQRAYALLNDTLGFPESDYTAFMEIREMADKSDFMLDANPSSHGGLGLTLAKSVFNEGVSLFASFVMLLNFQRRGLMKGMGKVVEWSTKDESKHVEGIARLFRALCDEHPRIVTDAFKRAIYSMARQAVELEDRFIDLAYAQGAVEGLAPEEVKAYIRFITDRRLVQLGLKPNFSVGGKNPLPWVDVVLNAPDLTNFFENKVADYEVGSLSGDWSFAPPRRFRVYSKDGCPFCRRAKDFLAGQGHALEIVDLSDDAERQAFYDERGFQGRESSVPKIYELDPAGGETLIGGFTETHALLSPEVA